MNAALDCDCQPLPRYILFVVGVEEMGGLGGGGGGGSREVCAGGWWRY